MTSELTKVEKNIKVREGWEGLTVFQAVRQAFPDISPREVFRKVRAGEIRRHSGPCECLARLISGDILTVKVPRPENFVEPLPVRTYEEVETRAGTLRLRRQYHYCPHCHAGFFPLG